MENQNLLLKVSRLFPSSLTSCQSRTLPADVADSSIIITKPKKMPSKNDHSSVLQKDPKTDRIYSAVPPTKPCKSGNKQLLNHSSDAEGRKCPPATPVSTIIPEKFRSRSTSLNSERWFTSSDDRTRAAGDGFETDTFFSVSSNSGDSFRPKNAGRRFVRRCGGMKGVGESGRSSFSSLATYDAVPSKCSRKPAAKGGEKKSKVACPGHEPGSDHALTQLYYQDGFRRRRTAEGRRKIREIPSGRRSSDCSMIDESFAVEKSSNDPYSDFMASMVEMIIEKQMFGAEDLDRMLFRFLSLNNVDNHGIILQVFSEICQTLFSD